MQEIEMLDVRGMTREEVIEAIAGRWDEKLAVPRRVRTTASTPACVYYEEQEHGPPVMCALGVAMGTEAARGKTGFAHGVLMHLEESQRELLVTEECTLSWWQKVQAVHDMLIGLNEDPVGSGKLHSFITNFAHFARRS